MGSLTDIKLRSLKPKDKLFKVTDNKGMHVLIMPNGSKYFQLRYKYQGKEKTLSLGIYPEISLAEARDKRDEARKMLKEGIDPSQAKKENKLQRKTETENTFEIIAREWLDVMKNSWTKKHANNVLRRLEIDIFPALGFKAINKIVAQELLHTIREVEKRDALDLSHRLLQRCGQIFRYAIATGRAERDIAADLRGALKTRKQKHLAHLSEDQLPEFFSILEVYDGDLQTKLGLKLLILTFVRSGELRGAKWEEINFEKAEWRIPAERMKMKEPHIVPLSKQAFSILQQLKQVNGSRPFIFPNSNKPNAHFISENTLLYALYRMGYHSLTTVHGFRATASTILNEHSFSSDVIERQLAHGERNKVRRAYNHAQYLPERRLMMQWWADHLDKLASNGKIITAVSEKAEVLR